VSIEGIDLSIRGIYLSIEGIGTSIGQIDASIRQIGTAIRQIRTAIRQIGTSIRGIEGFIGAARRHDPGSAFRRAEARRSTSYSFTTRQKRKEFFYG